MVEFQHIIDGCSVNLRLLSDRELAQLRKNHELRLALVNDELDSLVGEQVRRQPVFDPSLLTIHKGPTLF